MNIFFHTEPLTTDHNVRGIGSYTKSLIQSLRRQQDISLIEAGTSIPDVLVVDVIHYPFFDLFNRTLLVHDEIPTVVTVHDVIPLKFPRHFPPGIRGTINRWFQTRAVQRVAAVITDSECSKRDIMKLLGVPGYKVHVVALGVRTAFTKKRFDKKADDALRKRYEIDGRYVLYVGDVNWNKNIHGLLHAFSLLVSNRHSGASDVKLVLAGSTFQSTTVPEARHIKSRIHSWGIKKQVIMPGFVPDADLATLYHGAHVYVQPSHYEGFGLPVIEAMASGVPVVSTNGGSLSELASGIAELVHPDPESLYEGMLSAIHYSPSHRKQVVQQGFEFAKQFTWKKTALDTREVYKKVAHVITS